MWVGLWHTLKRASEEDPLFLNRNLDSGKSVFVLESSDSGFRFRVSGLRVKVFKV